MDVPFTAKNVFQAILGASMHPTKRSSLLEKVSNGLLNNSGLEPDELQKGINEAVAAGCIAEEEAKSYFPGVTIDKPD